LSFLQGLRDLVGIVYQTYKVLETLQEHFNIKQKTSINYLLGLELR